MNLRRLDSYFRDIKTKMSLVHDAANINKRPMITLGAIAALLEINILPKDVNHSDLQPIKGFPEKSSEMLFRKV